MGKKHLRVIGLMVLAGALGACEGDQDEAARSSDLKWTSQQQVHGGDRGAVPGRADLSPEANAREFFDALQSNQPEQAAELVARRPLDMSEEQLLTSLSQWAGQQGRNFKVIDSHQQGDFALVRVNFLPSESGQVSAETVRPVVLFREEGRWKVVWDLLGKEPERLDPATAQRLAPLYSWYESEQLRYTARASQPAPQQPAQETQQQSAQADGGAAGGE